MGRDSLETRGDARTRVTLLLIELNPHGNIEMVLRRGFKIYDTT
jgi:hypothetical protein